MSKITLKTAFDDIPGGIVICKKDDCFTVIDANTAFYKFIGYTKDEFNLKCFNKLSSLFDSRAFSKLLTKCKGKKDSFYECLYMNCKKNIKKNIYAKFQLSSLNTKDNYIIMSFLNMADSRDMIENIYLTKQRFEFILDKTKDVLFEWDYKTKNIVFSSSFEEVFTDYNIYDCFPESVMKTDSVFEADKPLFINSFEAFGKGITEVSFECRIKDISKNYKWCNISATAIYDNDNSIIKVVGLITNIQDHKNELKRISDEIMTDSLSNLYNKEATKTLIKKYLNHKNSSGVFMIIDIDNFKTVNDFFGHSYGDAVISETSRIMKSLFDKDAIIGRFGGDEFIVFLKDDSNKFHWEDAAKTILTALKHNIKDNYVEFMLSVSIGVSLFPEHSNNYDDLFNKADMALYESKHNGKNTYSLYNQNNSIAYSKNKLLQDDINNISRKTFKDNIVEYVFKIFYENSDITKAIPMLLDLIGRVVAVDEISIFEMDNLKENYITTYNWYLDNDKYSREREVRSVAELRNYKFEFEDNFYFCRNIDNLKNKKQKEELKSQGTKSLILTRIMDGDETVGVIALKTNKREYDLKSDIRDVLILTSQVIGTFLIKEHKTQKAIAEQHFTSQLASQINASIYGIDPETYRITFLNENSRSVFNDLELGELCYKNIRGKDKPCDDCPMKDLTTKSDTVRKELHITNRGLITDTTASYLKLPNQQSICLISSYDITRFKQEKTKNDVLAENIPGGMLGVYYEKDTPLYFINQRLLDILQYDSTEDFLSSIKNKSENCIAHFDREKTKNLIHEQLLTSDEFEVDCRMLKKDGSYIWVWEKGRRVTLETGRKALICVCFDVTHQHDLRTQVALYRASKTSGVCTLAIDDNFKILYANDIFYDIIEYDKARFKEQFNNHFCSISDEGTCKKMERTIYDCLKRDINSVYFDIKIKTSTGKEKDLLIDAALAIQDGNRVMHCVLMDNTERKCYEEKIKSTVEKYKIALKSKELVVWEYDFEKDVTIFSDDYYFNNNADLTFKIPDDAIKDGTIHNGSIATYKDLCYRLKAGEKNPTAEIQFKYNNSNNYYWQRISYITIYDDNNNPIKAIGIGEDVTREKINELKYIEALQPKNESTKNILYKIKADLDTDKLVYAYEGSSKNNIAQENESFTGFLSRGKKYIAKSDDKERFLKIMNIDSLKNAYEKGDKSISFDFRRYDRLGVLSWVRLDIRLVKDVESGELFAYITIKDIDRLKNAELALSQKAERDLYTNLYNEATMRTIVNTIIGSKSKEARYSILIVVQIENLEKLLIDADEEKCANILQGIRDILFKQSIKNSILARTAQNEFVLFIEEYPNIINVREIIDSIEKDVLNFNAFFGVEEKFIPDISAAKAVVNYDIAKRNALAALDISLKENKHKSISYYKDDISVEIESNEKTEEKRAKFFEPNIIENILLRSSYQLLSTNNLKETLSSILGEINTYYGAELTYLVEINPKTNNVIEIFDWYDDLKKQANRVTHDVVTKISDEQVSYLNEHEILRFDSNDIATHNLNERKMVKLFNINSFYAVSLNVNNMFLGYIVICNPKKTDDDIVLLESLRYFIANELNRDILSKEQLFLNTHDSFTGLLNRNSFIDYTSNISADTLISLGVIATDINGLQELNSKFGFSYGDSVIELVARKLKENIKVGYVYRFSGDEFYALCPNINRDKLIEFCNKARKDLDEAIPNIISLGFSWAEEEINIDHLLKVAEERMNIEKQHYYNDDLSSSKSNKSALEELKKCLENNYFKMYLQPKADSVTHKIVGAEALVRLEHPKHGLIYPDKFISQLESDGNIKYIDLFIFEECLKTIRHWIEKGIKPIALSSNFSRSTVLSKNIIEEVESIYKKYNVPKEYIEIEITESISEIGKEAISNFGNDLLKADYNVALDDFGARYSNISILSSIKLNTLKIDKSIINDVFSNENTKIIVESFIKMCKKLGIKCVAEGVETKEQLDALQKLDCDYVQGYYFNKAIPLDEFERLYFKP